MPLILKDDENLVTYYLLPLAGINKIVFGRLFVNSYVDKKGSKVYVELKKKMSSTGYTKVDCYLTDVIIKNKLYVVYNISDNYKSDVRCFLLGMYSKMSRPTKKLIYNGSGLHYNRTVGDFKVSSPILQALDKTKVLRYFMLNVLGVDTLPESAELIDSPEESWFIENQ
jgi:hypothetical protein